jgi:hypothetical protein
MHVIERKEVCRLYVNRDVSVSYFIYLFFHLFFYKSGHNAHNKKWTSYTDNSTSVKQNGIFIVKVAGMPVEWNWVYEYI